MYHRLFGLFIFFAPLLFSSLSLSAEERKDKATEVHAGIYVSRIYGVNLKENQFSADFYLWFRWKKADLKPYETCEVVNGHIESKELIYEDHLDDSYYTVSRVSATLTKFWDVSRFPLDNHVMTIEIEDSQDEDFKQVYLADRDNSKYDPQVQVPGWEIKKGEAQVVSHSYTTNYGDITLPTNNASSYSRFIYSLLIERPGYEYFLKMFLSVFVATLISFLSFLIRPTDLDPRFGLGIGAIFAAVASQYVVSSSLPETNVMTLADKLHILAIIHIFVSLFESTMSLGMFYKGKEKLSQAMDRMSLILCLITYLAGNFFIIYD